MKNWYISEWCEIELWLLSQIGQDA